MKTFYIETIGCQMNVHDSEKVIGTLHQQGYSQVATPAEAELVLYNTCSIRDKAEQKVFHRLDQFKKEAGKNGKVYGVLGCVAQQEGEGLLKRMPEVDLLLGPDNIPELPRLLLEAEGSASPVVRTAFDLTAPHFLAAAAEPGRTPVSAFVTVMKGCNERCTYCIVPHTRGPERYRPAREIIDEVRRAGSNLLMMLLIVIVAGFISQAGIIACFVGVFFTAFYSYLVLGNAAGQLYRLARGDAAPATPAF